MQVARRAHNHSIDRIFFLQIDALQQYAFPVLHLLPERVPLEEVDDVQLGKLAVGVGVGHVVGHQQNHHLLQGEGVSVFVALN